MRETVLIDGSEGPLEVRKLVLQGSNEEIGRHLAAYARDHLNVKKEPWTDPIATRAQRAYLRAHWPEHYDRMRGAAKAFDIPLDDDAHEFSFLYYDAACRDVRACSIRARRSPEEAHCSRATSTSRSRHRPAWRSSAVHNPWPPARS